MIEKIPAKTVTKFLDDLQHVSATKIQAAWFGWKVRKLMETHKPELKQHKAAVTIQKQVRSYNSYFRARFLSAETGYL